MKGHSSVVASLVFFAACGSGAGKPPDEMEARSILADLVPALASAIAGALDNRTFDDRVVDDTAAAAIDLAGLCTAGRASVDGDWETTELFSGSLQLKKCRVAVAGGVTVSGSGTFTYEVLPDTGRRLVVRGNFTLTWAGFTLRLNTAEAYFRNGAICYSSASVLLGGHEQTFPVGDPACVTAPGGSVDASADGASAGDGGPGLDSALPDSSWPGCGMDAGPGGFVEDFTSVSSGSACDATSIPGWSCRFQDATGLSYDGAGGRLTVTTLAPSVINPGNGGTTAWAYLERDVGPMGDFEVEAAIAWDQAASNTPMQDLWISLLGDGGALIGQGGFYDAWVGSAGTTFSRAGATSMVGVPLAAGFMGTGNIRFTRVGSNVEMWFGATRVVTGTDARSLRKIRLDFGSYGYQNGATTSTFGPLSVDRISVGGCTTGP